MKLNETAKFTIAVLAGATLGIVIKQTLLKGLFRYDPLHGIPDTALANGKKIIDKSKSHRWL